MENISPRILRAWFDTILNPIIEGLKTEQYYLENNNLTWSSFYKSFKILKPLQMMFNFKYYANFEQIVELYPILSDVIENHDKKLKKLNDDCQKLFTKLVQSSQLKTVYKNKVEEFLTNITINELSSKDFQDENNLQFIVEYIMNKKSDLDSSYILSPIWNSKKDEFFRILELPEFIDLLNDQNHSIEEFKQEVDNSIKSLKKVRNSLSLKFGEPIILESEI